MTKAKKKPKAPPANPFLTTEALSAMVRGGDDDAIKHVIKVLKFCGGKITVLAKTIGVSERTIYNWRDSNEALRKAFTEHALGREGAGRAMNAASVKARETKGAA